MTLSRGKVWVKMTGYWMCATCKVPAQFSIKKQLTGNLPCALQFPRISMFLFYYTYPFFILSNSYFYAFRSTDRKLVSDSGLGVNFYGEVTALNGFQTSPVHFFSE